VGAVPDGCVELQVGGDPGVIIRFLQFPIPLWLGPPWQAQTGRTLLRKKAQGELAYDSPERRQQLAESLEGKGDREAVNSRLLADIYQAAPATAAVAHKPTLARTSKMTKLGGMGKTLERGGLERLGEWTGNQAGSDR
jgi:hypothetical protein